MKKRNEMRDDNGGMPDCVSRRHFILFAGATTVSLGSLGLVACSKKAEETGATAVATPGPEPVAARLIEYPRIKVGTVSGLKPHEPFTFHYPDLNPHSSSMLVRLGTPAGGGVGPESDIVAFNQLCPHQGGLLEGQYHAEYRVLGPCPIHLSTYDLTRHGMIVSGHATQGLPQVILEVEGDDIIATGMIGLIYGYNHNLAGV